MNRVTIQPTVFENHPQGDKTYGYRIYDDHGRTYSNTWESIPDDDLEILSKVMDEGGDLAQDMLSFLLETARSLYIGNTLYEWEEIKHLFCQ